MAGQPPGCTRAVSPAGTTTTVVRVVAAAAVAGRAAGAEGPAAAAEVRAGAGAGRAGAGAGPADAAAGVLEFRASLMSLGDKSHRVSLGPGHVGRDGRALAEVNRRAAHKKWTSAGPCHGVQPERIPASRQRPQRRPTARRRLSLTDLDPVEPLAADSAGRPFRSPDRPPGPFLHEVVVEMRKVAWPTRGDVLHNRHLPRCARLARRSHSSHRRDTPRYSP